MKKRFRFILFSLGALLFFVAAAWIAFLAIFPPGMPSSVDDPLTRVEVVAFLFGKNVYVNPADLARVLDKADRIVVYADRIVHRDPHKILYTTTDKADIESFKDAVSVRSPKHREWFHCMCFGEEAVYIYRGKKELASLTSHHGKTIRCSLWLSDAEPADNEKWIRWFEERGMPQLRNSREAERKAEQAYNESITPDN